MYRDYCHFNDYYLKSQVFTAGGGPVKWLILSYLVYEKCSTHEESEHKMNEINKYHDFI